MANRIELPVTAGVQQAAVVCTEEQWRRLIALRERLAEVGGN